MMLEDHKRVGNMNYKLIIFFSSILLLTSCKSKTQPEIESATEYSVNKSFHLISETSLGPFERGAIIDLERDFGESILVKVDEALSISPFIPHYSYVTKGVEELRIIPALDPRSDSYTRLIGSVVIKAQKYKDINGIHVGSSVDELIKAYPKAYFYYDIESDQIVISNQGHGLQFILASDAIDKQKSLYAGRIDRNLVDHSSRIAEIRIVRSEQENQDALKNKQMEEKQILSKYFDSILGKYYLKEFSENYYKIHIIQGSYFISECFEGDCKKRGKVLGVSRSINGFENLRIKGISGEMVPTWSLKSTDSEKMLYVRDYDASDDKWTNKVFIRGQLH